MYNSYDFVKDIVKEQYRFADSISVFDREYINGINYINPIADPYKIIANDLGLDIVKLHELGDLEQILNNKFMEEN